MVVKIYVVASHLSPRSVIDDALKELENLGNFEVHVNKPPGVSDLILLYPATGGTERMLVGWFDFLTRVVVLWRDGWNSLPAALAVEEHLRRLGFPVSLERAGDFRGAQGMEPIRMATLGGVAEWILDPQPPHVELPVPDPGGGTPKEMAERLYRRILKLVREHGIDGIAFNCFKFAIKWGFVPCLTLSLLNGRGVPAACEGDLRALLTLILGRRILGVSGMMGNVSHLAGGKLILSHCTAPSDWGIVDYRNHFETGLPVSPVVEGFRGKGVLAAFVGDRFRIAEVEVLDRLEKDFSCRNQFLLRIPKDFGPRGNHHVLFRGDPLRLSSGLKELGYEVELFTLP